MVKCQCNVLLKIVLIGSTYQLLFLGRNPMTTDNPIPVAAAYHAQSNMVKFSIHSKNGVNVPGIPCREQSNVYQPSPALTKYLLISSIFFS